jgi:hypothetical protein
MAYHQLHLANAGIDIFIARAIDILGRIIHHCHIELKLG